MKRILAIVLVLILSLSLVACGHEHSWKEADCDNPKTCSECGETEGEALGHKWIEATCAAPKTCSVCGATDGEALSHTWTPATCTTPMTCSVCGVTSGTALEHTWKDATCSEAKTCSVCGATDGEALGHDTPDLSCVNDGTCTRCGEIVPALGHDWKEATCTEPQTCSRCGATDGKELGHTEAEAIRENETAATCTDSGSYDEVIYCSVCHEEISRTAKEEPALGHTTNSGTCSRCGNEVYETVSGNGDDVISNISVGDGIYRVHFTNSGSRNFIVKSYDSTNDKNLLINEIGVYDGYVYLSGSAPFSFEIQSSGKWTFTVERLAVITENSFSGRGDFVTNIFSGTSGTWEFTHDGKSNFVVKIYTTSGRSLLVNEIGNYSGKKIVTIPSGSNAFLEIVADGNWTIRPVA